MTFKVKTLKDGSVQIFEDGESGSGSGEPLYEFRNIYEGIEHFLLFSSVGLLGGKDKDDKGYPYSTLYNCLVAEKHSHEHRLREAVIRKQEKLTDLFKDKSIGNDDIVKYLENEIFYDESAPHYYWNKILDEFERPDGKGREVLEDILQNISLAEGLWLRPIPPVVLKKSLKAKGLTQKGLASLLWGVSPSKVSRWVRGKDVLEGHDAKRVKRALGR